MSSRVLICGDRNWRDREFIFSRLDEMLPLYGITEVIEGCARGADRIAGWPCDEEYAAWDRDDSSFTGKWNHRHHDNGIHVHEGISTRRCPDKQPVNYHPMGWAHARHLWHWHFAADWDKHGKAAGAIRNREMLKKGQPNLVIAFHTALQQSKGTRDMVELAKKAGIETFVFPHSHEGYSAK